MGPWDLVVNSTGGGVTAFEGAVGLTNALDNLTTNADGATDLSGGSITNAGTINVDGSSASVELGAFDFIAKPFKPNDLRVIIERAAEALLTEKRQEG